MAFAIGVTAAWVPSFWYDEAATVYSSRRPFPELLDLLRSTDVVHGAYYVAMHLWGSVFGFSELSMRLPSALAVGVAAAGVVVLAQRLSTVRVALLSGVAFALLPRVLWAAVEARSYAATAAVAVWLTVVFVVALHSRSRWWWVLYCAMLTVSIVLFVYLATLVGVHLLIMLARRRLRASFLPWSAAVGTTLAVTAVFLKVVFRQAKQVGWIPPSTATFPGLCWNISGSSVHLCSAYSWVSFSLLHCMFRSRKNRTLLTGAAGRCQSRSHGLSYRWL